MVAWEGGDGVRGDAVSGEVADEPGQLGQTAAFGVAGFEVKDVGAGGAR